MAYKRRTLPRVSIMRQARDDDLRREDQEGATRWIDATGVCVESEMPKIMRIATGEKDEEFKAKPERDEAVQ